MRHCFHAFLIRFCSIVVLVAACLCLPSCGRTPDGKCQVAGVVTWNGAPLKTGFITFNPVDGQHAAEAGAISDGRFKFYARPGKNRVEITATKESGYSQVMRQPTFVQFVPAEYNVQSTLVKDVSSDGENSFEFKLQGQ